MKADPIAESACFVDCLRKKRLNCRLSATEDNSIKKTRSLLKKRGSLFPCPFRGFPSGVEGSQVGIMAVAAFPRAALKKQDGGKGSGKVNGRKGNQTGELRFLFPG